jgi:hypothetical protein
LRTVRPARTVQTKQMSAGANPFSYPIQRR